MQHQAHDLSQIHIRADRLSVGILWLGALVSLVLANLYSTWWAWALVGLPAAALPSTLAYLAPGSRLTRLAVGVSYMVFSALLIHQAHGMVELHFAIFCLLAFLLVYRDWLPIVVAAGVIAVHHLAFHLLQSAGYGVYVFSESVDQHHHSMVLIHAAFVVFETAILVYLAESSRREAMAAAELDQVARRLRVGDGVIDLAYRFPQPTNAVTRGLHESLDAIQHIVATANEVLNDLNELGERMNADSAAASRNASAQARDTDSLSASITEMSTSVEEVARNAAGASATTRAFRERLGAVQQDVNQASNTLQQMVSRLEQDSRDILKLEQQSEEIGTILDVIREVAARTNLLALNAAIEAARAGEQGRGFAVVAEEVRNLASQSEQSAQQIETMIGQLQEVTRASASGMRQGLEDTGHSADMMAKASGQMSGLLRDVSHLDQAATQIATAAEEQAAVAGETDRRVVSIRDLARETQAHTEETAGNAERVRERVLELSQRLKQFRLA